MLPHFRGNFSLVQALLQFLKESAGGKLVSYVYHMFKDHWCGDDFEFSNDVWSRTYKTARQPELPKNFFQPKQDEWYTIWSHIEMNSAGVYSVLTVTKDVTYSCQKAST